MGSEMCIRDRKEATPHPGYTTKALPNDVTAATLQTPTAKNFATTDSQSKRSTPPITSTPIKTAFATTSSRTTSASTAAPSPPTPKYHDAPYKQTDVVATAAAEGFSTPSPTLPTPASQAVGRLPTLLQQAPPSPPPDLQLSLNLSLIHI